MPGSGDPGHREGGTRRAEDNGALRTRHAPLGIERRPPVVNAAANS
jgi:hypothetical protein